MAKKIRKTGMFYKNLVGGLTLKELEDIIAEAKALELSGELLNIRTYERGDYESTDLCLIGDRLETDAEYNVRMKMQLKRKKSEAKKLELEKREYERLKKKFEGGRI